jgi:hypothetical protein
VDKTDDDWSKHEYIDKMRNSDPFLAHKKQGTKMKAVHHHVAEKASEHLSNATGMSAAGAAVPRLLQLLRVRAVFAGTGLASGRC